MQPVPLLRGAWALRLLTLQPRRVTRREAAAAEAAAPGEGLLGLLPTTLQGEGAQPTLLAPMGPPELLSQPGGPMGSVLLLFASEAEAHAARAVVEGGVRAGFVRAGAAPSRLLG